MHNHFIKSSENQEHRFQAARCWCFTRLHARLAHLKAYLCRCRPRERVNKCFDVSKWWNCVRNPRRVCINNKNIWKEREGWERKREKNNNKNLEGKSNKEKKREAFVEGTMHRRRLILFKHFIKLLTKFVVYPLSSDLIHLIHIRIYVHFYQPLNACVIYIESREIYDRFQNHP